MPSLLRPTSRHDFAFFDNLSQKEVAPAETFRHVGRSPHQQIEWKISRQGVAHSHGHPFATFARARHDHEQIHVRIRSRLSGSIGSKQDDFARAKLFSHRIAEGSNLGSFNHRFSVIGSRIFGEAHFRRVAQPTLPSRLTPKSFCASTANSIGSSRNTSLQNPFTIMFTASCVEMPRALQ